MKVLEEREAWFEEPVRIELSDEEILADLLVGAGSDVPSQEDGRS